MQDTIEKSVWIDAPSEDVWQALADSGEFGTWFRARFDGPFEEGQLLDAEITYPGHEGLRFWVRPVVIDRPRRFAFDWPIDDKADDRDPSTALTTRVTWTLAEENGGTRVTVTESGFAALPPEVAERKRPDNEGGWEIQCANLKAHVEA